MTVKQTLTDTLARKAKPADREYSISDTKLAGLTLRVQPTGAKSFVLRMRIAGRLRRFTIGSVETMRADEARARAHQLKLDHAPQPIRQLAAAPPPGLTLRQVSERFLQLHEGVWKLSTVRSFRIYLNSQLLPAFGERPIDRLTTADIANWFHIYSARSPGGANQALMHLRTLLRFAAEIAGDKKNAPDPSRPIRRNTRRARGRHLSSAQLSKLGAWFANPAPHGQDSADAIELILLTGCRSGEIGRLRWCEVHVDCLRLLDAKTGSREVILTEPAKAILKRRRATAKSDWVFPLQQDSNRPTQSLDIRWRIIRREIGFPREIRLHDLRHTYASQAIMSGETLSMAGRLLGHRRPRTTEIYAHLDAEHLAEAADRVSGRIAVLLEPRKDPMD